MIVVILIDVILILSESFDNFSIASLFSAKKEIKEKSNEIDKVNRENSELRNQLLTLVSTSISSQNRNTNIFGVPNEMLPFGIEQSNEKMKKSSEKEEEMEIENDSHKNDKHDCKSDTASRRKINQEIENLIFNKFVEERSIAQNAIIRDVQFTERFIGTDPIMEKNIIFDAYVKTVESEVFIEVKVNYDVYIWLYNLYYLISKVYHYGKANNVNAKLVLVLPNLPDSYSNGKHETGLQRLYNTFAPAIKNGLLEIKVFDVNEEELEIIRNQIKVN